VRKKREEKGRHGKREGSKEEKVWITVCLKIKSISRGGERRDKKER
jgi:hypothetical protein